MFLMGLTRFRWGEQSTWTTGETTDLIGVKTVTANDSVYDQAIAA